MDNNKQPYKFVYFYLDNNITVGEVEEWLQDQGIDFYGDDIEAKKYL